jgi:hypothetical protein
MKTLLVMLFALCCLSCGPSGTRPTDTSSDPVQPELITAWDESSTGFRTGFIGGEGPYPNRSILHDRTEDEPKCRLNEKTYSYDRPTHLLTVSVCEDIFKESEKHIHSLNSSQQAQLDSLLSSIKSVRRRHTGQPRTMDDSSNNASVRIEIYKNDGTTLLLHSGDDPDGEPNSKYIEGTLSDVSFLDQIEAMAK